MQYKKCCFTGNRAHKLPWKENEQDERCLMLKNRLRAEIAILIEQNFDYFISGMAQGIDTYLAEIVLDLKKLFPNIQLECAIPSREQSKSWEIKDIDRYNSIVKRADTVTYLFENYNKFCNQVRNKYMVNNSEFVLAVWSGEIKGGTYQTITYAKKTKTPIKIINI